MKLNYNGPEKYEDKKYDCYKCEERHEEKHYEPKCEYPRCCPENKYAKCDHVSPCPYGILFECAQGTMAKITPTTAPGVVPVPVFFTPISLGCVSIDTSCLKMPTIKFDFSCVIQYQVIVPGTPSVIRFGLFKVCEDNGHEIPCGTWDFRVNMLDIGEQLTTSFCFSHCECAACPGCCTYYVRIVHAETPLAAPVPNTLDVMAPSLSVIAKSSC